MTYGKANGWLDDQPAAITRTFGKGRITYIGAILDDQLTEAATEWMTQKSGVTPAVGPVPDGVEVCRRQGPGKEVFVVINFADQTQHITLPRSMQGVLANKQENEVDLPQYGVEVLVGAGQR
jgi:beta-galactosidase